jgi:hypothetical protein
MYQPDTVMFFTHDGNDYVLTTNEGDGRDYGGFSELTTVGQAKLDPHAVMDAESLQREDCLGRLVVSTTGDTDGDGDLDKLFTFGGRSLAIWTTAGRLVYDSGDQLEQITARELPRQFNSTNISNQSADTRSPHGGPDPEGLALGYIEGRRCAFIGLESIGGVMAFDISNPRQPEWVGYVNSRNFAGQPENDTAGDLGPEGLLFVPAKDSPHGRPLLIVANEVSGSITIVEITAP